MKPATVVNRHKARGQFLYVGRPSAWGNPFSVAQHGQAAMRLYLDWLRDDPQGRDRVDLAKRLLPGMVLACSCTEWPSPRWRPCHAVVLARLANGEDLEVIRVDVLMRVAETRDLFS